eukprot:Colp12_sorted_trinity150504_noHs@27676
MILPTTKETEQAFHAFDGGAKGWLDKQEFKLAFLSLFGSRPPKKIVLRFYDEVTLGVDQNSFASVVNECRSNLNSREQKAREIFLALDTSGRGFLTLEDLYAAFSGTLPAVSKETVAEIFFEADQNRDRRISFREFCDAIGDFLETVPVYKT